MKKNKMGCQNGEWGEEAGIDTKNAMAVVMGLQRRSCR